jgi:hypothetical protein
LKTHTLPRDEWIRISNIVIQPKLLNCFWRAKVVNANFQCEKTVDVKKSKFCEADVSSDLRNEIENHYKLSLPEDFYHFWKFCEELDPENPAGELLCNHAASMNGKEDAELRTIFKVVS